MFARDIMTTSVITIQASAWIYELTKLLAETGISGVPVCEENNRMVGFVSEADLIALKTGERVRDIMSKNVIKVEAATPVEEVAATLSANKIKRVPVFENDKLVGLISQADIVVAMAKRLGSG